MIFPASKNSCSSSVRLGRDSSNSSRESWDELKLLETKNLMATFFLYPTVQLSYWGEQVTVLSSRSSTQLPCLFQGKSGRREEWAGSFSPSPLFPLPNDHPLGRNFYRGSKLPKLVLQKYEVFLFQATRIPLICTR